MDKPDTRNRDDERQARSETELSSDIMGNNQLQGDDQANVHNQRRAVPDAKLTPDSGPVESAQMLDKDERARRELGKGARHSDGDDGAESSGDGGE